MGFTSESRAVFLCFFAYVKVACAVADAVRLSPREKMILTKLKDGTELIGFGEKRRCSSGIVCRNIAAVVKEYAETA